MYGSWAGCEREREREREKAGLSVPPLNSTRFAWGFLLGCGRKSRFMQCISNSSFATLAVEHDRPDRFPFFLFNLCPYLTTTRRNTKLFMESLKKILMFGDKGKRKGL